MAFFKFRKGRDEPTPPVVAAPTVEAVRRRAIHRLIGAAVLVLAGVIGFPLIFDNQPRPIPIDLPIDIVDKNKVKPLTLPPAGSAQAVAPEAAAAPPAAATPAAGVKPPVAAIEPAAATPGAEAAGTGMGKSAGASAGTGAGPGAAATTPARAAASAATGLADAKAQEARKARALLEGKSLADAKVAEAAAPAQPGVAAASPAESRFVVQVGAFSDPAKVREVRRKVESAGLKTYTQVVTTSDGERTRVRVGPFDDKAQATKAADRIRKLNLTVAILTL